MAITGTDIAERILQAVMARKLSPGERLGEQPLAMLFDCSRTIVREGLTQLATRGIVSASARRGWYVVQPTEEEAREAFEARAVIEQGLIRRTPRLGGEALARLKGHIREEQEALAGDDVGTRSFLLGDFHVCLAQCLGNHLLAETLRNFTARTTLIAMLHQSHEDAESSWRDHVDIVAALERGDAEAAEALMAKHLTQVQDHLQPVREDDRLNRLRAALSPIGASSTSNTSTPVFPPKKRREKSHTASPEDVKPVHPDSSTYLGALL